MGAAALRSIALSICMRLDSHTTQLFMFLSFLFHFGDVVFSEHFCTMMIAFCLFSMEISLFPYGGWCFSILRDHRLDFRHHLFIRSI